MAKLRGADFTRAIEHARRQVARYGGLIEPVPAYECQYKSMLIAMEALRLVRLDPEMEAIVIARAQAEREKPPEGG